MSEEPAESPPEDDRSLGEIQAAFEDRIRTHHLILWMRLVAIGTPAVALGAVKATLYRSAPLPQPILMGSLGAMIVCILASSFFAMYSFAKNLRCPKCDANVLALIGWNASRKGMKDPKRECPACRTEIVSDATIARQKKARSIAVWIGRVSLVFVLLVIVRLLFL